MEIGLGYVIAGLLFIQFVGIGALTVIQNLYLRREFRELRSGGHRPGSDFEE